MTPEEVAKNFHGECERGTMIWCKTHEATWNYEYCDAMIDWIDLAEQAVEAERVVWEGIAKGMVAQAVREEQERAKGVVIGVVGGIQERGEILGREELLIELKAKVETLMPADPQLQFVHEMFVAGYSAAIAAVLGLLEGIKSD